MARLVSARGLPIVVALTIVLYPGVAIAARMPGEQNPIPSPKGNPAPILEDRPTSEAPSKPVDSLQLPADELYSLQKLKIQQELQGEITQWAQSRFWVIAIIAIAVGVFGVRAIV